MERPKLTIKFNLPKITIEKPIFRNQRSQIPEDVTVPPVIHFIWLGSVLKREQLESLIDNVIAKTQGFKFKLWVTNLSEYSNLKELVTESRSQQFGRIIKSTGRLKQYNLLEHVGGGL